MFAESTIKGIQLKGFRSVETGEKHAPYIRGDYRRDWWCGRWKRLSNMIESLGDNADPVQLTRLRAEKDIASAEWKDRREEK